MSRDESVLLPLWWRGTRWVRSNWFDLRVRQRWLGELPERFNRDAGDSLASDHLRALLTSSLLKERRAGMMVVVDLKHPSDLIWNTAETLLTEPDVVIGLYGLDLVTKDAARASDEVLAAALATAQRLGTQSTEYGFPIDHFDPYSDAILGELERRSPDTPLEGR